MDSPSSVTSWQLVKRACVQRNSRLRYVQHLVCCGVSWHLCARVCLATLDGHNCVLNTQLTQKRLENGVEAAKRTAAGQDEMLRARIVALETREASLTDREKRLDAAETRHQNEAVVQRRQLEAEAAKLKRREEVSRMRR